MWNPAGPVWGPDPAGVGSQMPYETPSWSTGLLNGAQVVPVAHPPAPTTQYGMQVPVVSPAIAGSHDSPCAQSDVAVHIEPAAPAPVLVTHNVAPAVWLEAWHV